MPTDSNVNWGDSMDINSSSVDNDLPALLGSKETVFVAERPLQDLAADIDAMFGLAPDGPDMHLQPSGETSDSTLLPPPDSFASLFNNEGIEFWEPFTSTTLDWNMVQGDTGTM